MNDKGGFFTFEFSTLEGGLRTITKTELEENNGILKNPLYTLHKGTKRHNICSILPPNWKSCKNEMAYCVLHEIWKEKNIEGKLEKMRICSGWKIWNLEEFSSADRSFTFTNKVEVVGLLSYMKALIINIVQLQFS